MTVATRHDPRMLELLLRGPPAASASAAEDECVSPVKEPQSAVAAPAPPAPPHAEPHPVPNWASLQPELVALVVKAGGLDPAFAQTLSQVCRAWRHALAADVPVLRCLGFVGLRLRSPRSDPVAPLPALVAAAAAAGNVRAAVAAARHLDCVQGQLGRAAAARARCDAARLWLRAAKLGHAEAQCRMGMATYRGLMGQPQSSEDAAMWLGRAVKQLADCLRLAGDGSPLVPLAADGSALLPPLTSLEDCRRLLAQAAHALAWLYWDGDGTKQDTAAAIRHFKMAARCGDHAAETMLGSLLKSGQYA